MSPERFNEYLGESEAVRSTWPVNMTDGSETSSALVGATGSRLVCLANTGEFKDIHYDHVSSIETTEGVETTYEGNDYRLVVGGGVALALCSFAVAIVSGSSLLALLCVLLTVGGVALAEYGWRNREEFDGIERERRPVRYIDVTTGDGRTQRFAVDVRTDVERELSRVVRDATGAPSSAVDAIEHGYDGRTSAGRAGAESGTGGAGTGAGTPSQD